MKLFKSDHVFMHPWETVTQAAFRKYPNDFNRSVVGTDVLKREVNAEGQLSTVRLILADFSSLPKWAVRMGGLNDTMFSVEKSIVDPKNRTMVLRSRNLSWNSVISVEECMEYSPHPDGSQKTILTQHAQITVNLRPLGGMLESFIADTMGTKAVEGRKAIDFVCNMLLSEKKSTSV